MKQKYVITGASGLLGHALCPYLAGEGHTVYAVSYTNRISKKAPGIFEISLDLKDQDEVKKSLASIDFNTLVHTAGLTSVDKCETDPDQAFLLNTEIPTRLASWCAQNSKRFIFISSDHVTGGKTPLFSEEHPVAPVNVYAETKARAEKQVLDAYPEALVVRTNFFGRGPVWRKSLTDWLWDKAKTGETIPAFTDSYFSPISGLYLSKTIAELSETQVSGIFHVGGSERLSKYDFALKFVDFFGLDRALVKSSLTSDAHLSAPRPADMSMSVKKIEKTLNHKMPDILESFESIRKDYAPHG